MRGRKPKPTFLKLIDGNPGKRPINHEEPKPDGEIGEPPDGFTDRQKVIWREARDRAPQGMLTPLDASVFGAWCVQRALWENANEQVARHGPLVRSPVQNVPMPNPYLSILRAASKEMVRCASELGFSPSSRSRVRVSKQKNGSPFAHLRSLDDLD